MGVPFYFKKVSQRFPETLHRTGPPACARVYIDFNNTLHHCAREVLDGLAPGLSADAIETLILEELLRYIQILVAQATSASAPAAELLVTQAASASAPGGELLVFIATDGIPSAAKRHQQRKRRYLAAFARSLDRRTPCLWDTNAISPGTGFMERVRRYMTDTVIPVLEAGDTCRVIYSDTRGAMENAETPRLRVIYSDDTELGEGEHKITAHLRAQPLAPGTAAVIYGLDADLIMLSLILTRPESPLWLMREPSCFELRPAVNGPEPPAFLFMDTAALATQIREVLVTQHAFPADGADAAIADYIVLCFFLGNDFLPPLSFLRLQRDGLDLLLTTYARLRRDPDDPLPALLDDHHRLHYTSLARLLQALQTHENDAYTAVHDAYYAELPRRARTPADQVQAFPLTHKAPDTIRPREPGWRPRYYHTLFDKTQQTTVARDASMAYLQGLEWLLDVYFDRAPLHRGWLYRWDYSPTLLDLYYEVTTIVVESPDPEAAIRASLRAAFPREATTRLDLHLLCILPITTQVPMSPLQRALWTDIQWGIRYMFPQTYRIQTYLKSYLWDCHPQLPALDDERLERAAASLTGSQR